MKFINTLALAILSLWGFGQTVSIDNYNLSPGSTLVISVDVDNISSMGAFTLFIGYNSSVLQYDTTFNINPSTPFVLANNMPAQSQVGLVWSAFSSGVNLSNTSLCSIQFNYLGGACDLTFNPGCELADFGANIISTSFENGSASESFTASITNLNPDYCISESAVILAGLPSGGDFWIDGTTAMSFNPFFLGSGSYSVMYIYENIYGFSDTAVQTVAVHDLPVYSVSSQDISCFGLSDGSAILNVSSGTSPYNYSWSNGVNLASNTNLSAGTYSFSLSDVYCDLQGSVVLTEPAEIIMNTLVTHTSDISQSNGAIDLSVSGGNPPYSYSWSNSSTSEDLSMIDDGYYYLTVTDGSFCEISDSVWVRANSSQTLSIPHQWSIFSMNIEPHQPLLDSVLSAVEGNVKIVKDENGDVYWPEFNFNNIGNIQLGEGYQIKLDTAQTFSVAGYYLYPLDHAISLPLGWSIFGYIRTASAPVISTLAPVVSLIGIVKNGAGEVYWPQYSLDLIITLNPGEGYQVNMLAGTTLTFNSN
jgi:hypothetical protein